MLVISQLPIPFADYIKFIQHPEFIRHINMHPQQYYTGASIPSELVLSQLKFVFGRISSQVRA